jgi:membrane protease subunit (stomatin/prohibitin family)
MSSMRDEYQAERKIREARNAEANYTEKCAWCDESAEDAFGLGWPLCVECGELYGFKRPKSVPEGCPNCGEFVIYSLKQEDGTRKCSTCGEIY